MPAYLVQISQEVPGQFRIGPYDSVIVFAADATDAKAIAKSQFDGDSNPQWDNATATELVAGSDFTSHVLHVVVLDSSPVVDISAPATGLSVTGATLSAAGTGYVDNEILTVSGGTSTRAATFRVTGQTAGVIDTIELVDPGEYTAVPSNPASTTSSASGTGATLTLTSGTNTFQSMAAAAVGLLNATTPISGAAIDFGAGSAPLLTVASGSGGDDLGDKAIVVEILRNSTVAIPSLVGTITDEGSATDVLSAQLAASPVIPNVLASLKAG